MQYLQDLHDMIKDYSPPRVVRPSIESLKPRTKFSLSIFFGNKRKRAAVQIPPHLPKGLYMHGDVGSGKTMLMDLFYDTLPPTIKNRTRIHFHNFMQDVHHRLHTVKAKHGSDLDAILYVAAEIAEESSILCFDEFQCTDVADAMILRRCVTPSGSHSQLLTRRKTTGSVNDSRSCSGNYFQSPSDRAVQEWNSARILHPLYQSFAHPFANC